MDAGLAVHHHDAGNANNNVTTRATADANNSAQFYTRKNVSYKRHIYAAIFNGPLTTVTTAFS